MLLISKPDVIMANSLQSRPEFTYKVDQEDLKRFLNTNDQEYKKAMSHGKTLVEFARTKGITEDKLTNYFIDNKTEQLDIALENGQIDKAFYRDMKSTIHLTISKAINYNPKAKSN